MICQPAPGTQAGRGLRLLDSLRYLLGIMAMPELTPILVRLTAEQKAELDRLKELTAVPTAIRLREAVGLILHNYREVLNGQLKLPGMPMGSPKKE